MVPQHFVFTLVDDFTHLALACAVDPLRIANLLSGKQLYRWSFASADGERATGSDGAVLLTHHRFSDLPEYDRLFVLAGVDVEKKDHQALTLALRKQERLRGKPIGALCSGAYILAQAGFLDGKDAAIHWEYHDLFLEMFPEVNIKRNVFVADETHITASGGTATADLMLHLIERDHGYDLSVAVADQMVYSSARDATAVQHVSLQSRRLETNPHLVKAVGIMRAHTNKPISPSQIAGRIGLSIRQLERLFGKHLNASPKKYFLEMRLERARDLLVQTELSVMDVASACGFDNPTHFSRLYRVAFGFSPMTQRARRSFVRV